MPSRVEADTKLLRRPAQRRLAQRRLAQRRLAQQRLAQTQVDAALRGNTDRRESTTAQLTPAALGVEHPLTMYVPQLVAAQAYRAPKAVAISAGASTLSYGQLYRRATQLAHLLQAQGIGHGSTVGVCTDRSSAFVVGWLGSLLAGATYLPLDALQFPPIASPS